MLFSLFRGVAKYICLRQYFFILWMTEIFPRHHGVSEQENDQPGQNQELVPKRGSASAAWTCVFKPLKHRAICVHRFCFCVRGACILYRFIALDYIDTLINTVHKHSDLGLERE